MLRSVQLRNFKSFELQRFPLGALTLLMGENGAGKSSVIQSLLLLRQSLAGGELASEGLSLNGPLVSIGVGRDLLREGSNEEVVGIEISNDDLNTAYNFDYLPDADRLPLLAPPEHCVELTERGFSYLTAERVGPRLTSPRSIASATERRLGANGEGALAVLERYRAEILPSGDPRRRGRSGSLEEVFQTYLADIASDARIDLQPYRGVDSIGSTFSFSLAGSLPGLPFRPTNVGFGLSYSLPILVGCLTAEPGSILIIENPEAHLHSRGQRVLGELLALTAMAGVQVISETHSREIFYHLRRLTREGKIPPDLGKVNYVEATNESRGQRLSVCSTLPTLDADLKDWPANFYEAFGSPTDYILPPKVS